MVKQENKEFLAKLSTACDSLNRLLISLFTEYVGNEPPIVLYTNHN